MPFPSPPWNPSSSTVGWSPLFLSHAQALIPLSLAKMRLSLILTLSPTSQSDGQMALFLFLFTITLAYFPTAPFVALRPLFPFQQAHYAQVFPLKAAPFCKLFAGFGSTYKSATSLVYSFSLTFVLSLPFCSLLCLSFYLNLSPGLLSCFNRSPDTRSPGERRS